MRQAALKIKTSIENVSILNNNADLRKMTLRSMMLALFGLGCIYILILGNTVFNIVERRALEKQALTLSHEVSDLELSYLSLSNSVDVKLSSSYGFAEAKPVFAKRRSLGSASSSVKLTNNEI